MNEKIKKLYEEANQLHKQAMDLLAEFEGKEMPAEKSAQVNTLLDQVEAKTKEAKVLERADEQKRFLEEVPEGARPDVFNEEKGKKEEREAKQAQLKVALVKYWMTGDDREVKALAVGDPTTGGYLTRDVFLNELLMSQKTMVAMRGIARVLPPVPAGSVVTPTAVALSDANNNSEIGPVVFDSVKPFGDRKLTPHEYDKGILVSTALMRNPNFDVEAWLREQFGESFSRKEDGDYISGNGNNKPLGVLNTPSLPTWVTAASNDVDSDDVINWVYSLPASYASKARILCNRAFIRKVRQMKTGLGDYVWQPGLQQGLPPSILDVPYVNSDKFDDGLDANDAWEDNAVIALIGDFSYYWIVDALDLYIQRLNEKYADTKQVGFIGTKSTDGMAVLAEAFYALKVKA